MTREEFDKLPSGWGTEVCPDCGTRKTNSNPGCYCRGCSGEERRPHIMKNHHTCPEVKTVDEAVNKVSEKPDCYKCDYRGNLPGDAHSCCNHPANAEILNNPMAQVFGILAGVGRVDPVNVETLGIKVVGNPLGIKRGWFNYPLNFDPTWLESCDGFKAKED